MTLADTAPPSVAPFGADRARPNIVAAWLMVVVAMIVAMIVVGGLTRLTDSGLSITEWKPVTGALPPLSAEDWAAEFAKYQEIPEYQFQNRGMTLEDFKSIYWWEWGHRLLGRLLGAAFAIPLVFFAWRRMIPGGFTPRLALLFLLGGLQGAVGWWMVASGLTERVDVSQYRLAAHLSLAFVLLGAMWWTALDVREGAPARWRPSGAAWFALGVFVLVAVQIVLGAFVAGLDGGRTYIDWPLIDGAVFPEAYGALEPGWRNAFDNPVTAQVNHRLMGYVVFAAGLAAPFVLRNRLSPGAMRVAWAVAAVAVAQAVLGVVTLVNAAPLGLAAVHQLGAAGLFLVALSLVRAAGVEAATASPRGKGA